MKNRFEHKRIDGKILHHLTKPKARNEIIFVEDLAMDDEGWFITVRYQTVKNKEITHESCIIRKDLETWINGYLRDGYVDKLSESQ